MSKIRQLTLGLLVASAAITAGAQTTDADHEQHHPDKAPAQAPAAKKATPATPQAAAPDAALMARMDEHLKAMRAMHDKFAATKTPQERQALMAEHAKLMQDGLTMMPQAGDGMAKGGMMGQGGMGMMDMAQCHAMMGKRMEMMESMMQMMMDRLPPAP